jgi:hypothetical protein
VKSRKVARIDTGPIGPFSIGVVERLFGIDTLPGRAEARDHARCRCLRLGRRFGRRPTLSKGAAEAGQSLISGRKIYGNQ